MLVICSFHVAVPCSFPFPSEILIICMLEHLIMCYSVSDAFFCIVLPFFCLRFKLDISADLSSSLSVIFFIFFLNMLSNLSVKSLNLVINQSIISHLQWDCFEVQATAFSLALFFHNESENGIGENVEANVKITSDAHTLPVFSLGFSPSSSGWPTWSLRTPNICFV